MVEEIRDLIEKINQEGIKAAEEKAQKIEAAAKQRADAILDHAMVESENILTATEERIRREEEKEKTLLIQAGRDLLLSLRNEINAMLERIIVSEIQQVLTPEELVKILSGVIKQYSAGEGSHIEVLLKQKDVEILENNFLRKLKEETKKNIILKSGEEISGGFIISFDSGKSSYDFTDKALASYIGGYLKPKLNKVLQEAIKE